MPPNILTSPVSVHSRRAKCSASARRKFLRTDSTQRPQSQIIQVTMDRRPGHASLQRRHTIGHRRVEGCSASLGGRAARVRATGGHLPPAGAGTQVAARRRGARRPGRGAQGGGASTRWPRRPSARQRRCRRHPKGHGDPSGSRPWRSLGALRPRWTKTCPVATVGMAQPPAGRKARVGRRGPGHDAGGQQRKASTMRSPQAEQMDNSGSRGKGGETKQGEISHGDKP